MTTATKASDKANQGSSDTGQPDETHDLTDILDGLAEKAEKQKLTLREVLTAFGSRSHGPLLFLPAFITAMPTGAIPGVPAVCAVLIILISLQIIFSPQSLWLPSSLTSLEITGDKLAKGVSWSRPVARVIDRFLKARLCFLFKAPFSYLVAGVCLAMALAIFPLGFFPFAAAAPALAVAIFGLALSSEDGLLALIGAALAVVSLGLAAYLLLGL